MSDCYYDEAGCLVCPEQDAKPFVPSHVDQQVVLGWTAGANSIATVDFGLHTVFNMPLGVVGVVIGLKSGRKQQTVPGLIEHGWYFQKKGSLDLAQPIELGTVVGSLLTGRTATTVFEIRRIGSQVRYYMDGSLMYVSATPSSGAKVVNACLYASGDEAPSGNESAPAYPYVLVNGADFAFTNIANGIGVDAYPEKQHNYWTIDVPGGSANLSFKLDGDAGSMAAATAADVYFSAITAPSVIPPLLADWDVASTDGHWLSILAELPAGGTTAWQLDIPSPAAGTWYIAADSDVSGSFTLTATIS